MSSDLPIPDAAIEKAARVLHAETVRRVQGRDVTDLLIAQEWDHTHSTVCDIYRREASAVLAAAVPILAGAWAAALTERLVVIRTEADEIEGALLSEPEDNRAVNEALTRASTIEELATRTARQLLALTTPKEPTT